MGGCTTAFKQSMGTHIHTDLLPLFALVQLLKEGHHEYLEEEVWEFLECKVLPVLQLPSSDGGETGLSVAPTATPLLFQYIEEIVTALKQNTVTEVIEPFPVYYNCLSDMYSKQHFIKAHVSTPSTTQRQQCLHVKSSVEGRRVVCVRYEDFPHGFNPSFTKVQFVSEVRAAKAGKCNIKRAFSDGPKKVTAVFLDMLPSALQDKVKGWIFLDFL